MQKEEEDYLKSHLAEFTKTMYKVQRKQNRCLEYWVLIKEPDAIEANMLIVMPL